MKIVINACHGGFGLSRATLLLYADSKNITDPDWNPSRGDIPRNDPTLVSIVEKIGSSAASGSHARLKIVDIPDNVEWEIQEYDGLEWVAEKHNTWR